MSADTWLKIPRNFPSVLLALLVIPLPVAASAQSQTPVFPIDNFTAPVGVVVSSLASGDFNGDGQPDLAYISVPAYVPSGTPQPTLTVLLNQGTGNAPIPVTTNSLSNCASASEEYSLVSADMNKDNKLDLVLSCPVGYVVVLIGNGDGSFQNPAYYAVSAPFTLAPAVDLNGDGYLDIAVSTFLNNSSGVAVLLNQGSTAPGTLSTAKSYAGASPVYTGSTGAGDFNGDGKQDIVVGGSTLAIFYGNGDGTLQAAQTIPGGQTLVTGDFNHDGLTDIGYIGGMEPQPASLQVLLGTSNGKFTTGPNLPLSLGLGYPSVLIAGTTNGGSNVDLALVGNYTSILLGDGSGGFALGYSYALNGSRDVAEAESGGKTNLVLDAGPGFATLPGNGDGAFQGIPTTPLGQIGYTAVDLNGDGLTDVLAADNSGNLLSALGRGDGTFSSPNTIAGTLLGSLTTGDFNGDSRVDVVGISPGNQDSTLFFYAGNGNGTFQPSLPGVDLKVAGAQAAVAGDFNGDGNLDVVLPYSVPFPSEGSGLIFLAGKGNGTFGSPVLFSQQNSSITAPLLVADLNNDKKLDLVWNSAVYLGNGDGTFQQAPLGLPGSLLAIADLNGDGIPDLVMGSGGPGSAGVYAGNGNGTFQPSPFYTVSLPNQSVVPEATASIGDVNGDGHPDIVLQNFTTEDNNIVTVLLGDGAGHFTLDNNAYYTSFFNGSAGGMLARLNNQAPKLATDNTLDYLSFSAGAVISLLNQNNPKPTAPTLVSSNTALTVSSDTASENQQLTFTATVTGFKPSGNVSFASGSATLGTAPIANGIATFTGSFAAAGTYAVTASYAGDSENQPSNSSAVSITVATPDFTVSVSPATATITAGQSAAATITVTPVGGYNRTVTFSCGPLPSEATCTFAPSSVTSSNGKATTSTLTVTTAAPSPAVRPGTSGAAAGIASLGILFLLFAPVRLRRTYLTLLDVFLLAGFVALSGCGGSSQSSGSPSTRSNPGTPAGTQTITVSTSDGTISHSVSFQIVVQR
jgi:Bacterial Ig-like domain (group 3)/FG-GAP-like repeat